MVDVPAGSRAVVKDAAPVASSATMAGAPPPVKVTVPLGIPVPDTGATVAVNVTRSPTTDGLRLLTTTVVVAALFTVCVTEPELARKTASPL